MAKKRELEPKSDGTSEPPQKQQHVEEKPCEQKEPEIEDAHNQENVTEGVGDEEVHEEEVEDEDEDDEESDDDEEEEDGPDEVKTTGVQTEAPTSSGSGIQINGDEDEPIEDLLEPFSKEQLLNLLKEAAEKHLDVADRIRKKSNEDPVHRKVFVHGLGWDTRAETLIEAYKQYGEIEDCKAVVDKASGKSKGYGFILFKSRLGARNALKEPQKKIGSRMTACQLASIGPVQGNPIAAAAPVPAQHSKLQNTQRKIYVSNVSAEIDPQKLLAFFAKYGEIEEGPLGLDKVTGKPKGFCLFVYRSPESAKKALEEPHKTFDGHVLHCQKAIDGSKPGKQPNHNSHKHNSRHQRNENTGYNAPPGGHGHYMGGNQIGMGTPGAQAFDPAIGHALTALLTSQGAGLGINPAFGQALLGTLASATGVNPGAPTGYGNQANITPGGIPGYTSQAGLQGGYQTQQPGHGGAGGGQHGMGYGGPYMGP